MGAGTRSPNLVWANWMTVASNSTFASYSPITRQSPALSVAQTNGAVQLAWPGNGVGFALYTTTNLTPPINWLPATNQPIYSNSLWQLTLSAASVGNAFFRLQAE